MPFITTKAFFSKILQGFRAKSQILLQRGGIISWNELYIGVKCSVYENSVGGFAGWKVLPHLLDEGAFWGLLVSVGTTWKERVATADGFVVRALHEDKASFEEYRKTQMSQDKRTWGRFAVGHPKLERLRRSWKVRKAVKVALAPVFKKEQEARVKKEVEKRMLTLAKKKK